MNLLHLDDRVAVVDKPAGWLVHPSPIDPTETRIVLHALRNQLGRPVWPLHRLDKGTSGALAFALDAQTAGELGGAFQSGGPIRKTYLALVRGWPQRAQWIDHPLRRMPDDLTDTRAPVQPAQTRLARSREGSLPISHGRYPQIRIAEVRLEPLTGRRHQLRRHMKHIAHPIIGDATHGKGPLNRAISSHLGVARLWLHAAALELPLHGGATAIRIEAPPPPEWAIWERWLRPVNEADQAPACDTNLVLR